MGFVTRHLYLVALFALFPLVAFGQATPSGGFTPGHPLTALSPSGSPYAGGGGASGSRIFGSGYLTELGITNAGTPFCITDALTSGPYHQLCLGANALGTGLISYNAYNGASPLDLTVNINGTSINFPNGVGMSATASNAVLPDARTNLGLGTANTPTFGGLNVTSGVITSPSNWTIGSNTAGPILALYNVGGVTPNADYLGILAAPSGGNAVSIFGQGSDASVSINLIPKGPTGTVNFEPEVGTMAQGFAVLQNAGGTTTPSTVSYLTQGLVQELNSLHCNWSINAQAQGGNPVSPACLSLVMNPEAGWAGSYSVETINSSIQVAPSGTPDPGNMFWVPLLITQDINVNVGGSSGTAMGGIEAFGIQELCRTGATYLAACGGAEIDYGMQTGSSAAAKYGMVLALWNGDAAHGSLVDTAIWITSNQTGAGVNDAIFIGGSLNQWPITNTTGDILRLQTPPAAYTLANGFDLSDSHLTMAGCWFKTANLCLGDSGGRLAINGNGNMVLAQETGGELAEFDGVGSSITNADYFAFVASPAGNPGVVAIEAIGSDTSIDLDLLPKGPLGVVEASNFVSQTSIDAGLTGLVGASPYGNLAGAFYRGLSVSQQDLYGWGCTAAAFSVYATTGNVLGGNGQVLCQVSGDNTNAWGPAAHPGGEDRVATILQIDGAPNTFGGLLAGAFTATTFAPTTPLSAPLVAKLRVGMEIKTNDATPYWGLVSAWASNGTSVTVQEWCHQNAGVESCTVGTPGGTSATISPKNGIWAANFITTRSSTSEERQSLGNEYDVNNNTGTNDTGTDATTWPFDIGEVIQSIGTNTATAGLVVSGTFVSGITVENSGTYSLKANGLISTAGDVDAANVVATAVVSGASLRASTDIEVNGGAYPGTNAINTVCNGSGAYPTSVATGVSICANFATNGEINLWNNQTNATETLGIYQKTAASAATLVMQVSPLGNAFFAGTTRTGGYTIAAGANQIPAAGFAGRRAYVTDQLTTCPAFGGTFTGGGSVVCSAFDNGTNWISE